MGNKNPFSCEIEQQVIHAPTETKGRVTGLFIGRHNVPEVQIEYKDSNGFVTDKWFPQKEIS